MPSKSVSFSDEAYIKLVQEQPDDMGFSEWVEMVSLKGVEAVNSPETNSSQTTER
jgi:predicted CopG family antitoxin